MIMFMKLMIIRPIVLDPLHNDYDPNLDALYIEKISKTNFGEIKPIRQKLL